MEEAMFVAGSCWLEDVVKALEEERDNGLGCMVSAASAVEVVAFSTTLYAEYPSGKDYKRNKIKFLLTTKPFKGKNIHASVLHLASPEGSQCAWFSGC